MPALTLTILGSGTSTGVPVLLCECKACRSKNPKNKRLRASVWIQTRGKSILIDTSTDFRMQALRARIPRIDTVLYTHPHADHIHGIDELRCFNFKQNGTIPVFGNAWTCRELKIKFPYIFQKLGEPEGGGVPELDLREFDSSVPSLNAAGVKVIPISLKHGSQECIGYRIESVAYVTDCSYIPEASLDRLKGLEALVLDCVRVRPHNTHFNLDQALETVEKLRPKKTYLTHLGHEFEHVAWSKKLPKGVSLAYDGLKLNMKV